MRSFREARLSWRRGSSGLRAALCLAVGGCGESAEPEFRCERAAIRGGSSAAEWLALDARQELAVCAIELEGSGAAALGLCSGVLIDRDRVLTAAHCVEDVTPRSVVFAAELTEDVPRVEVLEATPHPELDLALLRLADDAEAAFGAERVALLEATAPELGSIVQIAGFGVGSDGDLGARGFAATEVVERADDSFTVALERRAAACAGDSGGPALLRDQDGVVRVAGVLSAGSAACASTDRYVRVDGISAWFEENGIADESEEILADCDFVGEGRCFGATALWCDGGAPYAERCADDEACGYDLSADGFRCVSAADDACDGLGDRGACDGDMLRRCERGDIVTAPCDVCGATCGISAESGSAACLVSE